MRWKNDFNSFYQKKRKNIRPKRMSFSLEEKLKKKDLYTVRNGKIYYRDVNIKFVKRSSHDQFIHKEISQSEIGKKVSKYIDLYFYRLEKLSPFEINSLCFIFSNHQKMIDYFGEKFSHDL